MIFKHFFKNCYRSRCMNSIMYCWCFLISWKWTFSFRQEKNDILNRVRSYTVTLTLHPPPPQIQQWQFCGFFDFLLFLILSNENLPMKALYMLTKLTAGRKWKTNSRFQCGFFLKEKVEMPTFVFQGCTNATCILIYSNSACKRPAILSQSFWNNELYVVSP